MRFDRRPILDMTPDGRFTRPPAGLPMGTRIALGAALVAFVAGALAFAALALWVVATLIPVAVVAVLVAYVAFRFQVWRARRSVRGQRSIYRP
jgi:Flp pilus assembly protein TadB